ncbi:hypothetical protein BKH41_06800 [Helicobacter sp. 12S02232-10]|uniref:phospholipase A n=1 Tax=Helicobacter sp. 12S02232-10 TaxID=1476197 RepID=UPI000BA5B051|nr:phospholipase A [Helicobacter sp. 12S02232-10]PAF47962.1 hypothetical protein BKH41_06800 [Helicobacter sp. 12S02232-10]
MFFRFILKKSLVILCFLCILSSGLHSLKKYPNDTQSLGNLKQIKKDKEQENEQTDNIKNPKPFKKSSFQDLTQDYLSLMDLNGFYILPYYHSFSGVYGINQPNEIKIQISFKIPVFERVFWTKGSIYFAYTQTMWFQMYNIRYSNPVRDTNYQPEFFYSYPLEWNLWGGKITQVWAGVQHLSNGIGGEDCYRESLKIPSGPKCRSRTAGNRFLAHIFWKKSGFVADLSVWPYVPKRKDNPDLYQYMGYGNLKLSYRSKRHLGEVEIYSIFTNYAHYRGAIRLGYTFKVSKFLGIYAQYFYGYGDSLYEYNIRSNRFGIGVRMLP